MATFTMQDNYKRWSSPRVLFRVSSVLMVGLMIGHMSGCPFVAMMPQWRDPASPADSLHRDWHSAPAREESDVLTPALEPDW